jgi:hypothetical protein
MNRKKANHTMKPGDRLTIAGFGRGAKGQLVIDGVNPKTRRKCKAVGPMVYTVGEVVSSGSSGGVFA